MQVLGDTGARFIPRVVYLSGAWKAGLRHYNLRLIQLVKVHLTATDVVLYSTGVVKLSRDTDICMCVFCCFICVVPLLLSFILYNICAFFNKISFVVLSFYSHDHRPLHFWRRGQDNLIL